MAVPSVNIVIEKNTDFSTNFKLKKDGALLDLSLYTFTSKLRKHYTASSSYNFTVTPIAPLTGGIVRIGMASTITATIPSGRYVYDVLATSSGTTIKVIEGTVIVKGTAT